MGIGFEVVYSPVKPIWVPVDGTSTLYQGQLVKYGLDTPANTGGVEILPDANGAIDVGANVIPYGVIIGDNNATPVYTTLTTANVKVQNITGVNTAATQVARDFRLAEGMYSKGDPQALVNVARITSEAVLRGYFRGSATVGTTNISTLTLASSAATTGFVTDAAQFTPVADNHTLYCVSGANAGLYRVGTGTSTTTWVFTREWPYTPAVGDKFKAVNVRQGYCRMDTDSTYSIWVDGSAALTSNYFLIDVLNLDLSQESGCEYVDFRFTAAHFVPLSGRKTA